MNTANQRQLKKELRQAGANPGELAELMPIASKLSLLKTDKTADSETHSKASYVLHFMRPTALAAFGVAFGMFLVIVSQSALPTSWLYPVQNVSDSIAIDLHPAYRATIMMKRAQQVNELVANHSGSRKVLATLAEYVKEADAYKVMPRANYAAFEFCKSNLQQAAAIAPNPERLAIESTLTTLNNT
jgi:hypothetical protein